MINVRIGHPKSKLHRKKLLSFIRNRHYPDAFKLKYDKQRLVYWADQPNGGVGVSFIDPEMCDEDFFRSDFGNVGFVLNDDEYYPPDYHRIKSFLPPHNEDILNIASNSNSELGRKLAIFKKNAFKGFNEHWYQAYNNRGKQVEDIMLFWETQHDQKNKFDYEGLPMLFNDDYEEIEHISNDFTCRPFNYLYLRRLIGWNRELIANLNKYKFFADGENIDIRFGYYSPAYALALMQSLKRHDLLDVALHDYETFQRYHPIDSLVRWCEGQATKKYKGVSFGNASTIIQAKV